MNFEPLENALVDDADDLNSVSDEESIISQNLAGLVNQQFRLFLDCDGINTQQATVNSHNFEFLVKPSPFQGSEKSIFCKNQDKISLDDAGAKICDVSTSSSKKGEGSPEKTISYKINEDGQIIRSSSRTMTFPKGILKLGGKSKYYNEQRDSIGRISRQNSLDISKQNHGWDIAENEKALNDLRKGNIFIRQNSMNHSSNVEKPSVFKKQVHKIRKLLSLK